MPKPVKAKPSTIAEGESMQDIGSAAGAVWRYLESNGRASTDVIKRKTKLPSDVLYAALGWLAREDKLTIEVDGKTTQVALK